MRLSKVAMKRLVLLVLAIACLVPAMPAAAAEPALDLKITLLPL